MLPRCSTGWPGTHGVAEASFRFLSPLPFQQQKGLDDWAGATTASQPGWGWGCSWVGVGDGNINLIVTLGSSADSGLYQGRHRTIDWEGERNASRTSHSAVLGHPALSLLGVAGLEGRTWLRLGQFCLLSPLPRQEKGNGLGPVQKEAAESHSPVTCRPSVHLLFAPFVLAPCLNLDGSWGSS